MNLLFHGVSVKKKLSAIILLTSGVVLLLASSALVTDEILAFRRSMIADLFTLADLVGINNSGALIFNGRKGEGKNLALLKAKPHILATHIFSADEQIFVSYFRKDVKREPVTVKLGDFYAMHGYSLRGQSGTHREFAPLFKKFHDNHADVFKQIFFEKELIGTVYIQSDLDALNNRLLWAGGVVFAVMFISLLLAFFLASRLQRIISTPIYHLLETMSTVSEHKDYSIRAEFTTDDELGRLINGFNAMLAQIEVRNRELAKYRGHLEERVQQRTAELTQRTDQLSRRTAQLAVARDQAEMANKAKSNFLANMSHELRTPLNGILGYAQILLRDKSLGEKQQEGIHVIQRSGDYLLTLISDILDLSKIEAGRIELYPADFHFGDFLQEISDIFRMRAEQKGISFIYETLSPLPAGICADEKRLRQILINLLGNAVKFTDRGGVTLRVDYGEGKFRFEVEDTGVGIPPGEMEKIFQPFQQADNGNHKTEGTGLGLAITKTLVEIMHGELSVKSTPGQGSTFYMTLKLQELPDLLRPAAADTEKTMITGFHGMVRNLLIVDDKWENRSVLASLLAPLGFEISEAENGAEALDKAHERHPDAIIMDLVMPVMDGYEATRRIKRTPALRDIPVIASSASVFDFHKNQSLEAGCDTFIPKPIRADTLLACLQKFLGLSWIYSRDSIPPASPRENEEAQPDESAEPIIGPPPEQAAGLLDLAMRGNIKSIIAYADELEQTDARLQAFAEQIRLLAKGFNVKKICALVNNYMES
ncbi:MAG: response regulator [Gammaproteobacteria bacterium]|nr:response regulator [Gammaproteobacteria bacterium]